MNNRKLNYLNLLVAVLLSATMISCKEDSPEPENENSIVGRWIRTSIEIRNFNNLGYDVFDPQICTAETCTTYQFNEDFTFSAVILEGGATQISNGSYSVEGNQVTIESPAVNISGLFSRSDGELVLTTENAPTDSQIEERFRIRN